MMLRAAAAMSALFLLAGCATSDLDVFGWMDEETAPVPVAAAPAPAPAPARTAANGPDPFCASVARQNAEAGAYDAPTQQRIAQRSYAQCLTMFGPAR